MKQLKDMILTSNRKESMNLIRNSFLSCGGSTWSNARQLTDMSPTIIKKRIHELNHEFFYKLRRLDSNERPLGYEPNELPLLHSALFCRCKSSVFLWIVKSFKDIFWFSGRTILYRIDFKCIQGFYFSYIISNFDIKS